MWSGNEVMDAGLIKKFLTVESKIIISECASKRGASKKIKTIYEKTINLSFNDRYGIIRML